jgi:nitrogen regulatory protein P-II 1
MKLLVIILNREEYLEDVLEAFLELDVRGATIIDSVGMGRILTHDIPIFAGLRSVLSAERPFNKTIFTVVEEGKVPKIVDAVEQICGSLNQPGTGILFSLPVDYVKGLATRLE